MEETRARILDGAIELFETVGPAAASMSAMASRAGVTRATLYRHFSSEADLAGAVMDEWTAGSPFVDAAAIAAITDPDARIRAALTGLYAGYRVTDALTTNLLRDEQALPEARRGDLRAPAARAREAVERTGQQPVGESGTVASAALGHAVAFETWRSLSGQGLADSAIVDLMVQFITGAGGPADGRRAGARRQSAAVSPASPAVSPAPGLERGAAPRKGKGKGKGKKDGGPGTADGKKGKGLHKGRKRESADG